MCFCVEADHTHCLFDSKFVGNLNIEHKVQNIHNTIPGQMYSSKGRHYSILSYAKKLLKIKLTWNNVISTSTNCNLLQGVLF